MADQEHLDILKQGVEVWNRWREEHREMEPDLRNADLRDANLSGINLFNADLVSVDLSGANLSKANLNRTNLHKADLNKADLSEAQFNGSNLVDANLSKAKLRSAIVNNANLSRVNLRGSNLIDAQISFVDLNEANLCKVDLSGARLHEVDLRGANLQEADVTYTFFASVDLRQVNGLDTLEHHGPSIISIDTIYRSQGEIPESFLRNAGVPDSFIEYMRSLVGKPIEYYSCFISVRLVSPKPAKVGGWAGKEYSFHN